MKENEKNKNRLSGDGEIFEFWKERYRKSKAAYASQKEKMDMRELMYEGTQVISSPNGTEAEKSATHVRNIVFENIEAEISSAIPQPKVTAKRKEDEDLAKKIEDMLRNKLNELPFEVMNDMQERTSYIQGGSYFLCEWDDTKRTHNTVGDICVTVEHPKQIIPQDGIFGMIDHMDYIFIETARTKAFIKRKYGIDTDEVEDEPDIRGTGNVDDADDLVTQVTGYFKNGTGGIGRISWAGETELEYLEDYQARYLNRCVKCGEVGEGICEYCGGKRFVSEKEEYEEIYEDIVKSDGTVISAETNYDYYSDTDLNDSMLENRRVPYYKPNVYPIILRKNISVFGKLLGESDVDKISHQQNSIKKLSTKINEKLLKGGSVLTLPSDMNVETTDEEFKIVRVESPDKMSMMSVFNIQADITGDLTYMHELYEEARQILGITDSFQGRGDTTAVSGTAKEFAARQSAGRLESKRVMKNAAYAALYETIFKFMLAYADEPRTVVSSGGDEIVYEEFNRYDFLEEDECGELYWNDGFLFSCDESSAVAADRERMWSETRMNLANGTYGPPENTDSLILFWRTMELLHYPGASEIKKYIMRKGGTQNEEEKIANLRRQNFQQELTEGGSGFPSDSTQGQQC